MNSEQIAAIERLRELEKKLTPGNWESLGHYWTEADIRFMCSLRNEALPLIEALQAENERLRELIKDACTDLGQMTLLRDKFYCEMETAQTETVFAKKEIERLRAGIAKAVYALGSSEPYVDNLNEALKESPDFGLQLLVDGLYQALEALHDA